MRLYPQIEATTATTKTKKKIKKMKTTEIISSYKFHEFQTPVWRTNLTLALIRRGFAAWEESDAIYTDATIEEIDWVTGVKNYFLAA